MGIELGNFFSVFNPKTMKPSAGFHILDADFRVLAGAPLNLAKRTPVCRDSVGAFERKIEFENLLATLAIHFINLPTAEIDRGIERALADIAIFVEVDRCYIIRFRDFSGLIEQTFEWCRPGITPISSSLLGLPAADFPWGLEKIRFGKEYRTGSQSVGNGVAGRLIVPLPCGQQLLGFIGFDSLRGDKKWRDEEITCLKIAGEMFANALARQKAGNTLRYSESFENLVAEIAGNFLQAPSGEADRGIDFAVKEVCRFVGADRCYVFQLIPDGAEENRLTHEWWALDIEAEAEKLKNWQFKDFPWLTGQLRSNETIFLPDVDKLPAAAQPEKNYWQERGVRSLVLVPIFSGGLLIGGMGFETRNPHKIWKEKDPQLLRTAAEMIGSALERKKAEETLRQALVDAEHERDRMDGILRSVADGVIVSDPDGKIVLANSAAERLLGVSRGKFPGDVALLIAGAKVQTGVDIEVPNPQGTRVLHARTSPLRERGKRGGAVTILRDATREREIERMKTDFVATAAHEFRTPLTSIQGFAEILLQRPDLSEEEKREISTIIYEQTQTLTLIVSDLLDVARIESGRGVPIRKERCDLPQLLRQVIARFAPAGGGFRFETAIDPEASEVDVDREKLRQVLENVIGNAVNYSPHGGRIGVTGRPVPGGLEICIEDEGIGMMPEQVAKVFDKFYRADVTHGAPQGVGLGMSIVKHIVEAHGGTVRVESVPGRGTRVHIFLPQAAKDEKTADVLFGKKLEKNND